MIIVIVYLYLVYLSAEVTPTLLQDILPCFPVSHAHMVSSCAPVTPDTSTVASLTQVIDVSNSTKQLLKLVPTLVTSTSDLATSLSCLPDAN